jgi:hypothetical protein
MPIDPSIALNIKPLQLANPLEQYGQFQQAQAAMTQNRLADLVLGQRKRETDETVQMNKLYKGALSQDGKLDRNKLLGDAAAAGLGSRIPALQKSFLDLDKGQADVAKTQADTVKAQADAITKKLDIAGQAFGYVRANPTLENANSVLDYLVGNGVYTAEQGAQYKAQVAANPTQIAALADQAFRSALSAKDQLATYQTRNTGATTDTLAIDPVTGKVTVANTVTNTVSPDAQLQASTARRGQDITARGQNMTDARARELNVNARGQYDAARGVLVDTRTGTATAVTGPDGKPLTRDKAMTEFQGKSAAFGDRASAANQIITSLEGKYSPAAINSKTSVEGMPLIGGMLGAATNKFGLSDSDQRAEQAQRDFINAVLRQESGAAIGAGEFDNARKQYFPQPGDSAAVREQKAANRKLAVDGLQRNAGSNYQPATAKPAAPKPNGLPAGWSVEVH